MKREWLAACCIGMLAIMPRPASTQSTVRVLDTDSIPIPFALVSLGKTTTRVSDVAGTVKFSALLRETETFEVRRIGYHPFKASVRQGSGEMYVILLQPIARGLDTVRTIAARETPLSRTGFYDRMDRVQHGAIAGEFITPEELESRNANQISQMLRGRRSITVASVTDGGRMRAVLKGRGGGCAMVVLLDGQRINDMLEDPSSGIPTSLTARHSSGRVVRGTTSIDELVAAQEIMAIEIYGSSANAPAELIPLTGGGSCGIIALWTGPRR